METVVAVAGIGAEGGGTALSLTGLYAALVFLEEKNVFLGGGAPGPGHTTIAKKLLSMGESGMLPLYIAAVEGRARAEIRQAYLDGVYKVKPWHRYVLFADAEKLCSASPLCREAKQGKKALKKWAKTQPPKTLRLSPETSIGSNWKQRLGVG